DKSSLVYLWFDGPESAKIRYEYMNAITNLYKKNFSEKLGNWCRVHNVEYIGHIIEDQNSHTKTGRGCGHYFRALDGQDYAGVDVVLHQLIPGLTEVSNASAIRLKETEPVFYNYTLAKLAASHAHLQKQKKGRALCELFGAYGWAESMKTMKWLVDHFIVRGINHFIPHAFSAKNMDDFDCPPHFYDYGRNPLYMGFSVLIGYMNRLCHLMSDSKHISSAAILYHAEAEWAGGVSMPVDIPAKALYDNGIDYDFISGDYLLSGKVVDKCLVVNEEKYPCIIIPESEYLPFEVISKLDEICLNGVPVIFINNVTKKSCENVDVKKLLSGNIIVTSVEKLSSTVKDNHLRDIEFDGYFPLLRTYHSINNGVNMYFFVNEDIHNAVKASVKLNNFTGGEYISYDAMENVAVKKESYNGKISLNLAPSNSVVIITGDDSDEISFIKKENLCKIYKINDFSLSVADSDNLNVFKRVENFDKLKNITGREMMPRFSGYMKYETSFSVNEKSGYILNLGLAYETVVVYINGIEVGKRIIAPFEFDISDYINIGENSLTVIVANNLGHKKKDAFSKFIMYEPSGLIGPVELFKY
ncbi:MAG: glycosyl transferase family 2, partial [Clostridia bacterium]|nr:glycosyl transferase family 2 [Clostridia bacterium]